MASSPDATSTSTSPELTAACHCGRVQIELPSRPTELNQCHCTVCYKYGAMWAYYDPKDVTITSRATDDTPPTFYAREDLGQGRRKAPTLHFNHCSHCGCMTHWSRVPGFKGPGINVMGVNCRMLSEEAIEGIKKKVSYC